MEINDFKRKNPKIDLPSPAITGSREVEAFLGQMLSSMLFLQQSDSNLPQTVSRRIGKRGIEFVVDLPGEYTPIAPFI